MAAIDFDPKRVLRASKYAASLAARRYGFTADEDDVASEIAIRALEAHRRGYRCGRRAYTLFARDAVRSLFGDERNGRPQVSRFQPAGSMAQDFDEDNEVAPAHQPSVDYRHEDAPLKLARLQAVWPTLTAQQRAILSGYAFGDTPTEIAEQIGSTMGSVSGCIANIRARLADPSKFTRVASRSDFKRVKGGGYVTRTRGGAT